jgi:hypothetical protein
MTTLRDDDCRRSRRRRRCRRFTLDKYKSDISAIIIVVIVHDHDCQISNEESKQKSLTFLVKLPVGWQWISRMFGNKDKLYLKTCGNPGCPLVTMHARDKRDGNIIAHARETIG